MKNKKGNRHCFAKAVGGTVKYFAIYGNEIIEIEKAVFDVLDRSYSKERYDARMQQKRQALSIDQIVDDTEECDKHGMLSSEFWVNSAEEDFFDAILEEEKDSVLAVMWEEIEKLPCEEAELLKSFSYSNNAIRLLCEKTGLSKSAIYYRRARLAEKVRDQIKRRISHD